ncbi:putative glycosyl transferase group 1 [Firmicutes bacterium CAG:94]|nr:putative glycosyl transferase group 1 [Firmicutes bacterium CAG:94]
MAHAHKGGGGAIVQGGGGAPQGQAVAQGVVLQNGVAQVGPAAIQFRPLEAVLPGLVHRLLLVVGRGGDRHGVLNGLAAVDHRPAVLVPVHGCNHGLAAHVVQHELGGPDAVEHNPPLAVLVLHQVGVAQALGNARAGIDIPVGEDGVAGAALKGAPGGVAAGDGLHVAVLRAALGNHQVVLAVDFVHVGTLGALAAGAVPDGPGLGAHLAGFQVHHALADALAVDVPKGALEVDGAVVVPEERGVNAALLDGDGLGPGAADVIGPHKEVAAGADVGGDHVKPPVVVADGGGENAAGGPAALQGVLAGAGEHVAQLLPVEQIAAVPQGHPGEELKGAVHQVVVLAHPADAGVGVKTGEDGVFK